MQDKLVVLADCLKVDASELCFGITNAIKQNQLNDSIKTMNMPDRAMLGACKITRRQAKASPTADSRTLKRLAADLKVTFVELASNYVRKRAAI
jgi:hypothetical protein